MRPSKVAQISWKGLVSNKLRSLLTMLGVIIGVSAVIIMISISAGTEAAIEEQITGLGSNLIFVQANFSRGGFGPGSGQGQTGGLVYDDAFAIAEEVNGVSGVVVEQQSSETIKSGNATIDGVSILGSTPDFPSVRSCLVMRFRSVRL
jgi:putative ABC transport system permease protein